MVRVPPELNRHYPCEPETTPYGRFLKRYHQTKNAKRSRFTPDVLATLPQMSKWDFLQDYLLNDAYTLEDFLNVPSASLRGFLYEAIWDICIRTNTLPAFTSKDYVFYIGKVGIREQKRPMTSLYEYLKTSLVQSGNMAGVSDITLGHRKTKTLILFTCKYYMDEKAITRYDIAALHYEMLGSNEPYELVLLVRSKAGLYTKIRNSHKKHTVEWMKHIYDVEDLRVALCRVREGFRMLSPIRDLHWFQKQSPHFPIWIPTEFHTYLFTASAWGIRIPSAPVQIICWRSAMRSVLYPAIVLTVMHFTNVAFVSSADEADRFIDFVKPYAGVDAVLQRMTFHRSTKSVKAADLLFMVGTPEATSIPYTQSMIYIIHDVSPLPEPLPPSWLVVQWNIEDFIQTARGNFQRIDAYPYLTEQAFMDRYGKEVEELYVPPSMVKHLMHSYQSCPEFATIPMANDVSFPIAFFGTAESHRESKWVYTQLKHLFKEDLQQAHVWVIGTEINEPNAFIRKRMDALGSFTIASTRPSTPVNVLVVVKSLPFESIYALLSQLYESSMTQSNDIVVYVDITIQNIQRMTL